MEKRKILKEKSGVTLVALVITVILMLILATVTITVLTADDGLFDKAIRAEKEYKQQSMEETARTAETELRLDNKIDSNIKLNIVTLVDKIKEISEINEEKYIIDIEEEDQSAIIVDKKTSAAIKITMEEDTKVTITEIIIDDITDFNKPTIEYRLEPEEGTYGETVTIIVTAKEEKMGIAKIQFPDNTEKQYDNLKEVTELYEVTENGTYKFVAVGTNGRKATTYVNVQNTMKVAAIVMTPLNTKPTKNNVNILIKYDENPILGGEVLTNEDKYQYSIGEDNWQTASETPITISVPTNGYVYARYYDGKEGYKRATATVANIDREQPETFDLEVESTTNSIIVKGKTTDIGSDGTAPEHIGIKGYQFQLKNSDGTIKRDWAPEEPQKLAPEGENETYTFTYEKDGIEQNKTYLVNMRAIDLAENPRDATNVDQSVQTGTVIDSKTKIGVSYEPTTATNGKVTVTFTDNSGINGLKLKYQKDSTEGNWIDYKTPLEIEENGMVYARLFDSSDQSTGTATATITNIDKEKPEKFNLEVESTTNSIIVKGKTTDIGSDKTADEHIGIKGYKFQLKNSDGIIITDWTPEEPQKLAPEGENETYTFTHEKDKIEQGKTYLVNMKAFDLAGNWQDATNLDQEIKADTVVNSKAKIGVSYEPTTATKGKVKVTFTDNSGVSGLKLKYQKGSTEGNWIDYETPLEVEENIIVYARLFDSSDQWAGTATADIVNIDKEQPIKFDLEVNSTTDSIIVSGKTTDIGSNRTAPEHIGIKGYQFQLKNSDGTIVTDWTPEEPQKLVPEGENETYTFTKEKDKIEQGKTYLVNMRAIDLAENPRDATNVDENIRIKSEPVPIAEVVKVGDYIDYDAGVWTTDDFAKIRASKGKPTVSGTTSNPTKQGQFGGYKVGQKRNSNSKARSATYSPKTDGWRVWSVNNGIVTIVHAGHSESYYHDAKYYNESVNILSYRDCTMYENEYAKPNSAHILTAEETFSWYRTHFGDSYTVRTAYGKKFTKNEPISVLENHSYYWVIGLYGTSPLLYYIWPEDEPHWAARGNADMRSSCFDNIK